MDNTGEVIVSGMGAGYSVGRKQYANLYFAPKAPAASKPVAEYQNEAVEAMAAYRPTAHVVRGDA